jgi:hypothetical protein
METIADSRRSQKRIPEHNPANLISVLRAQGLAQVRAAIAQVQRWKWTLVNIRFGVDYIGNLRYLQC